MKKRELSLILAAAIFIPAVLLSSCGGSGDPAVSSDPVISTAAQTDEPQVTTAEITEEPDDGLQKPVSSLKLLGRDMSEWNITCRDASLKKASQWFADYLKELGFKPAEDNSADRPTITFTTSKTVGYDDYTVTAGENSVTFCAGSTFSAYAAAKGFIEKFIRKGGDVNITAQNGDTLCEYRCPGADEYWADPSLMPMHWAYDWTPPEGITDYQEKIDSLTQKNKNHIFTVSHRGDYVFYPENSMEAYLSVWAMGGDCLEIDIHFTKDKVPVLMHDDGMNRMTNCSEYIGKKGYPTTSMVADWTVAQIKELCLKEGAGGDNAKLTPYKVPTLEEVLKVAKNRFFVILDKPTTWRYVEIAGIQKKNHARYIFPIMQKADNYQSVLISYGTLDSSAEGTLNAADAIKIQKYVKEKTGVDMYFFLRCWTTRGTAEPYAREFKKNSPTNSGLLINGAFNPNDTGVIATVKALHKVYPDALLGGWTIDNNGYDAPATWEIMYRAGYRSIMTNKMLELVKFAAGKR